MDGKLASTVPYQVKKVEHRKPLYVAVGSLLQEMCGDGSRDLVRIRNGEISYWHNLGYGRFGAKVTVDDSPRS